MLTVTVADGEDVILRLPAEGRALIPSSASERQLCRAALADALACAADVSESCRDATESALDAPSP